MKNWKSAVSQWCYRMKEQGIKPDAPLKPLAVPKNKITTSITDEPPKTKKDPLSLHRKNLEILKSGEGGDLLKKMYPGWENCQTDEDLQALLDKKEQVKKMKSATAEALRMNEVQKSIRSDANKGINTLFGS